ncbi:MAG: tripartite tricarboxylate transporter family receptor [Hyphomicrobiales bacterium]|nr:tripartite tricarboxylate transporter family receptor [Hyphomicrobiales bacterium]
MQVSRRTILAAMALGASTFGAQAQSLADFYKGKTVEMLIGYATGGSNDTYARMIAQHMGKHIPGNPTVIVRNMPGAGSFLAVNQIFNVSPKEGTVIGLGAPTIALDEKLGTQGVRFKTAELNWIGRVSPLINIVFMWKSSPIKSVADAQKSEATLGGTGAGSTVSIYPLVMNNVLGTKFKLVMGYKGSNEAMLALERGEVEGHSTAYEAVRTAKPSWLKDGSINIIAQLGLKRIKELPDVPTAIELAQTDEQRKILTAIMAASEIGISFFTTPKTPADRVEALRKAYDETMKDPAFMGDLERLQMGLDPMSGADVQKLVADVASISPELLEKVRAAYPEPGKN